jgi:hypothetical protein
MQSNNLRKIIREELASFIREKHGLSKKKNLGPPQYKSEINELTDDDLSFVSKDVDLTYYDLQRPGYQSARGTGQVHWNIDMELRSWGIKGIYFNVKKIVGVRQLEPDTDEGGYEDEDVEYTSPEWTFEIEHNGEINYSDSAYPNEVQINEKDKSIIISF